MSTESLHLTPSQRFYRGEISLREATQQELAIARGEENTLRFTSPAVYYTTKVVLFVLFPFALLIGLLSRRHA